MPATQPLCLALVTAALALGLPAPAQGTRTRAGAMSEPAPETRARAGAVATTLSASLLKTALDTYVPVMMMNKDERYLPTCVEKFLEVAEPYEFEDRETKEKAIGLQLKGQPTPEDRLKRGAPGQAKAYVNVKVGEKTTDLQFWFLYAYNGPGTAYLKGLSWDLRYKEIGDYELGDMGVHEGDWEHVTVRIDNTTGKAVAGQGIFMAAHGEGKWADIASVLADYKGRQRVKIYASRNGHAVYAQPGRDYNVTVKAGVVEFRLLNDTEKVGIPIDYQNKWELIGIQGDSALKAAMGYQEQSWIKAYQGRWGRTVEKPHPLAEVFVVGKVSESLLKAVGAYDELTFEAGPYPPWKKGIFTNEAE